MSAEGPADRPPPPPPPDPPKRQNEAAPVTDEGGGSRLDTIDGRTSDHQASVGPAEGIAGHSESVAGPNRGPEAQAASLTRDQQLENWKQADARSYRDQLNRASPEQIGQMREDAYKELDHTLDRMQATALKDDPESNEAWRDAYDRNQIAQQRLEMIGGVEPPINQPPDGGPPSRGGEQPHDSESTPVDLRRVQDIEPLHRGSSTANDMPDPAMSYVERLPIENRFDSRVDTSQPAGMTHTAAEFVGGNLERTQTIHDQTTVGKLEATHSVDRPTVNPNADVEDVNAFRERVRQYDQPGAGVDLYDLPNCSACCKAVDARLTGDSTAQAGFLDQRALGSNYDLPGQREREGITASSPTDQLPSEWGRDITEKSWTDVKQRLEEGGPGTRGVLVMQKEIDGQQYGHVANVLNNEGRVEILDGQIGKRYGDWSSYSRDSGFAETDVTGWIKTSPDALGRESNQSPSDDSSDRRTTAESSQRSVESAVADAERRADETRQGEVAAESTAAGAVESVRAEARADAIDAERDIDAADSEIRDIEARDARLDNASDADSDRLDELKKARSEASDRLDQSLQIESNPESAVKGGETQEAERARAEAEQAERDAEDERKRQQRPT